MFQVRRYRITIKAQKKAGISRSGLFITTKLWACHGYQDTLRSIEGSLRKLGMDYLDLLLIHEPTGDVHEIYRAMETAYKMEGRYDNEENYFCTWSRQWMWEPCGGEIRKE